MRTHYGRPRPDDYYCNYCVRGKFKPGGAPGCYDARGNIELCSGFNESMRDHTCTRTHTYVHVICEKNSRFHIVALLAVLGKRKSNDFEQISNGLCMDAERLMHESIHSISFHFGFIHMHSPPALVVNKYVHLYLQEPMP